MFLIFQMHEVKNALLLISYKRSITRVTALDFAEKFLQGGKWRMSVGFFGLCSKYNGKKQAFHVNETDHDRISVSHIKPSGGVEYHR